METKKKKETVNHPSHYQGNGWETIDIISDATKDLTGEAAFSLGNVLKYCIRAGKKNGIEDYKKARWYLDRLISYLESESEQDDE